MQLLFTLALIIKATLCARILGVFSLSWYSHFLVGETILKELAARGHEVTVINSFPEREKVENYRDITITELNESLDNVRSPDNIFRFHQQSVISTIKDVYDFGNVYTELVFQNKDVQNLLKSNETFDLIIMEQFLNEAHFGFMHRFNAPLILMGTLISSIWTNELMCNPTPFSYIPNLFVDYSPEMNFWQRAHNTFVSTFQLIYYHNSFLPKQDRILHENFPDAPPIYDLIHNASLIFLNSHPTSGAAVPHLPNMIEIGGYHLHNHKPLSDNLKKFLDEAREGVIYFSLGSNMQSIFITKEKRDDIFNAFAKLKMKVLMKWEDDHVPDKPANVRLEKWLPQPAVLAHENVRVFITHGGRLSIIESIYYGKPIVGIPIFAEQSYNMREAVYLGYGIYLSYNDINEENLSKTLKEIIENSKYAEMAKSRSRAFHDLPTPPLKNAINWIEYIIKHKGAPYLRNAGIRLKWYQYLLLDVILFYFITMLILLKFICIVYCKTFKVETQKMKIN